MKCLHCPTGQTAPGTKASTLERGNTLLIVRHVPAEVCDTCGAAVYGADTTDRLRELLDDAVSLGAEVLVRDFVFVENTRGSEKPARARVGTPGR